MTKGKRIRDQDKFIVRLPDGLRDRIKAKADRAGMSMNEAIVWVLEQEFPAPVTMEEKIDGLVTMVAMIKDGNPYDGIANLVDEIHDVLVDISEGKISTNPDFRNSVADRLDRWHEDELEKWPESPFDASVGHSHSLPPADDSTGGF